MGFKVGNNNLGDSESFIIRDDIEGMSIGDSIIYRRSSLPRLPTPTVAVLQAPPEDDIFLYQWTDESSLPDVSSYTYTFTNVDVSDVIVNLDVTIFFILGTINTSVLFYDIDDINNFSNTTFILTLVAHPSDITSYIDSLPFVHSVYIPKVSLNTPLQPITTDISTNSVTIEWDDIPNTDRYLVDILDSDGDVVVTSGNLSNLFNSFTTTNLSPNTTYTSQITAIADEDSDYSDSDTSPVSEFTTLSSITLLVDNQENNGRIRIYWSMASHTNVLSYRFEIFNILTPNTILYSLTNADESIREQFITYLSLHESTTFTSLGTFRARIVAITDTDYVNVSDDSINFTLEAIELDDPVLDTASITIHSNRISSVNWDMVTGATHYDYDLRTGATITGGTRIDSNSNYISTIYNSPSTLLPNTQYTFSVIAKSNNDTFYTQSDPTAYTFTTPVIALSSPEGLELNSRTNHTITVEWDAVNTDVDNNNVTVTIIYEFRISPAHDTTNTPSASRSAFFSGLEENTTYTIYVKATAVGYSDSSENFISITTSGQLATPTLNNITSSDVTNNTIELDWNDVTNRSTYTVQRSSSSDFSSISQTYSNISDPLYTVTGLSSNTLYYFRVRAEGVLPHTDSEWSNVRSATTKLSTPTLFNIFSSSDITDTTIDLDWGTIIGADSYTVQRSFSSTFASVSQTYSNITDSDYTVTELSSNTLYYFRVRAEGTTSITDSAWSNIESATTGGQLSSPTLNNINSSDVTNNTIELDWTDITNRSSYTIQRSSSSDFASISRTYSGISNSEYTVTGLNSNTLYYFRVRAEGVLPYTDSEWSNVRSATTKLVTPTLFNININDVSFDSVDLDWGTIVGADSYTVQISFSSDFSSVSQTYSNISVSNYTVTGLSDGTLYYFRVRAEGTTSITDSEWSNIRNATTYSQLPSPTLNNIFSDETTNNTIELDWNDITNRSSYTIQRSSSSDFASISRTYSGISDSEYTVTGLNSNTLYYFRVRAEGVLPYTDSEWSNVRSATTKLVTPTLFNININDVSFDSVDLDWGTIVGADSYTVQISFSSDFSSVSQTYSNISVSNYTVTGLSDGTLYYFRVRAEGTTSITDSEWSNIRNATTYSQLPSPTLNNIFSDETTNNTIELDWNDITNRSSYTIQRSSSSDFASISRTYSGISNSEYTVTGLNSNTLYYFRVRAEGVLPYTDSEWSNVRSATTKLVTPTLFNININDVSFDSVDLDWGTIVGADSYTVQISFSSDFSSVSQTYSNISVSNYTVTGLSDGTLYYFRVRAEGTTSITDSEWSNIRNATTYSQLPSPTLNNIFSDETTNNTIELDWNDITNRSSYTIQRSSSSDFASISRTYSGISDSEYTVTGLNSNTLYYFRVRAEGVLPYTDSEWSNVRSATTKLVTPTLFNININDVSFDSVDLDWGTIVGADSYTVQISFSSDFSSVSQTYSNISVSNYTVTGLSDGTLYYFRVRAEGTTSITDSEWSNIRNATTYSQLPSPTLNNIFSDETTNNTIELDWNDITNRSSYTIQRSSSSDFASISRTYSGISDSEYTVTGLNSNTLYYFRVRAEGVLPYTDSEWSNVRSATTKLVTPTLFNININDVSFDSVDLDWGTIVGADSYTVQISFSSDFSSVSQTYSNISVSNYTVTGLSDGTLYYFRVRAEGTTSITDSEWSNIRNATTYSQLPSPTLNNITSSDVTNNTIELDWNDITNRSTYTIQRNSGSNFNFGVSQTYSNISSSEYTVTGLSSGILYYFRVKAEGVSPYSDSEWSNVRSATTKLVTPTLFNININDVSFDSVDLDWGTIVGADSYTVQISFSSDFSSVSQTYSNISVSNYTVTGLSDGTLYYFRVRAEGTTSITDSEWSNIRNATTYSQLPSPTLNNIFSDETTNNTIELDWNDITNRSSYTIQRSSSSDFASISRTYSGISNSEYTVTGLNSNTLYYFRVRAEGVLPYTDSEWSNVRSATTKLFTPTLFNITSSDVSFDSVDLDWGIISGADSYTVQRSSSSTFDSVSQTYSNITDSEYTVTSLSSNTLYYFRVRAEGTTSITDSEWSNIRSATTGGQLSTPTLDNITSSDVTNNTIELDWNDITNRSTYTIQRNSGSNFNFGVSQTYSNISSSEYTVTGLSSGILYYFRVKAEGVSPYSDSEWSNVRSATTKLATPTLFNITSSDITDTTVDLDWDTIIGVVSYTVQRSSSSTFSSVSQTYSNISSSEYTVTGLNSDTIYYFRVRAEGATSITDSEWSNIESTEIIGGQLSTPTLDNITSSDVTNNTIELDWNDITNRSTYTIQRNSGSNFNFGVSQTYSNISSSEYTVTGLSSGILYYFRVRAEGVLPHTDSEWSNVRSATTKLATPTLFNITSSDITTTTIDLDWGTIIGADSYTVQRSSSSTFSSVSQTYSNIGRSEYTVTGLSSNTLYYFRVRAEGITSITDSAWSNIESSTTNEEVDLTQLSTPTLFNITSSDITTTTIDLDWGIIINNNTYTVQRSSSSDFSSVSQTYFNISSSEYTVTGLSSGILYYFRVKAEGVSPYSDSEWSNVRSATTVLTQLSTPTLFNITSSDITTTTIDLDWGIIINRDRYTVQRSSSSDFSNISRTYFGISDSEYTVEDLDADTTYYFRVRAEGVSPYTDSEWSNIESATTNEEVDLTQLSTPILFNITSSDITDTTVDLDWGIIINRDRYTVQRSSSSDFSNISRTYFGISDSEYTVEDLDADTTYYFRVRAEGVSPYSDSEWSNIESATTDEEVVLTPGTPVITNDVVFEDSVAFVWMASSSGGEPETYTWGIYIIGVLSPIRSGTVDNEEIFEGSGLETGLVNGFYQFRVRATNSAGTSSNATFNFTISFVPSPTIGNVFYNSAVGLVATWALVSGASYRWEIAAFGSVFLTGTEPVGSFGGIINNTFEFSSSVTYTFRLYAVISSIESSPSSITFTG